MQGSNPAHIATRSVATRRDWKTFAKALQTGTEDLARNKEKN
jgi:hypothetical protein